MTGLHQAIRQGKLQLHCAAVAGPFELHTINIPRINLTRASGGGVALVKLIEYSEASAEVKAVFDDIMKTRGVDWINNFWKALANDPKELRRMWQT